MISVYYVSEPLAEIPYLIGYGFLIAAFLLGARLRDGGTPFVALQDALMVTIAGFVTLWLVIVEPADLVTFDWISLIENVIFPMLDLALLTVILRSMFGVNAFTLGPRVMLFIAGLLTLFCDLAEVCRRRTSRARRRSTTTSSRSRTPAISPPTPLFAAAALHPLMNRVYMPLQPDERQPETTRLRLAVVPQAPLAPLLTAAALQFYGKLDSLLLVFLGSLVLFGLCPSPGSRASSPRSRTRHRSTSGLRAYAEVPGGQLPPRRRPRRRGGGGRVRARARRSAPSPSPARGTGRDGHGSRARGRKARVRARRLRRRAMPPLAPSHCSP